MATRVEFLIDPPGRVLRDFWRSTAGVQLIRGPLGSAKTFTVIQKFLRIMCAQAPNTQGIRPTRFLAVRNTYADLADTTIRDWRTLLDELGKFRGGGNAGPPEHRLRFALDDGTRVESDVIFLALDREDDVRKTKGTQITGAWCNEVTELSKAVVDHLDLRHGRYPDTLSAGVNCTWHGILGDCNSPYKDHWYAKLEHDPPKGWEFFVQPGGLMRAGRLPNGRVHWVVNPAHENRASLAEKFPEGYYLRGMAGKGDDWIAVNLANEFGISFDGKPIHPDYRENLHRSTVSLEPLPHVPLYIGQDWGRTPACVLFQRRPGGGYLILEEVVTEDMGAARFADLLGPLLRSKYAEWAGEHGWGVRGWGDPSGDAGGQGHDETCFQIVKAKGIPIEPAVTNDFTLRTEALDVLLRQLVDGGPAILIDPSCEVLHEGLLGGYQFKRVKVVGDEKYHDKPDKNRWSHVVEALHYGLLGAGAGRELVKRAGREHRQRLATGTDYRVLS